MVATLVLPILKPLCSLLPKSWVAAAKDTLLPFADKLANELPKSTLIFLNSTSPPKTTAVPSPTVPTVAAAFESITTLKLCAGN